MVTLQCLGEAGECHSTCGACKCITKEGRIGLVKALTNNIVCYLLAPKTQGTLGPVRVLPGVYATRASTVHFLTAFWGTEDLVTIPI